MKSFLRGLAWLAWLFVTRSVLVACLAMAIHYGRRGGALPAVAWVGLAGAVVVLIALVEDE